MARHPNRESFERFYLTKVALGEGCGCAEHATRIRDLEAHSRCATASDKPSPICSASILLPLRRLFHRAAGWARPGNA